jgi:type II secretory pathway component PulK
MRRAKPSKRSGAVLIVALVAITIFAALAATNIRSLLRHRQSVKTERDMVQVQLLSDAGCDRAVSMFATDPEYLGEVWLDQRNPSTGNRMRVAIRVLRKEGQPIATVQASLEGRSYSPDRIQRTRTIALTPPKPTKKEIQP